MFGILKSPSESVAALQGVGEGGGAGVSMSNTQTSSYQSGLLMAYPPHKTTPVGTPITLLLICIPDAMSAPSI